MRTPFVAGNWKLNKTPDEAEILARCVVDAASGITGVDVAICPPFTALERVAGVVRGTAVGLGAQNVYWASEGAFTGEVSAPMLLTCGCEYVILGQFVSSLASEVEPEIHHHLILNQHTQPFPPHVWGQ